MESKSILVIFFITLFSCSEPENILSPKDKIDQLEKELDIELLFDDSIDENNAIVFDDIDDMRSCQHWLGLY